MLQPVAAALMHRVLHDQQCLPELCDWEAGRYAANGDAEYWRDKLLGDKDPVPETDAHTARTALAGGVAAWQSIASCEDDAWRSQARHRLAARVRELLPLCRPEGQRGGGAPSVPAVSAADATLTGVLFGEAIQAEP